MVAVATPPLSRMSALDTPPELELPDDLAFASDDPVVAPLLKAFQCEWLGLCDPYSVTLRSHVVKGVVEAERLQVATGYKPLWAGVMDVLADTGGWNERTTPWHRRLAGWHQRTGVHFEAPDPDPVQMFLTAYFDEHPDLERDDELPVWPMPPLFWQSDAARGIHAAEEAFWNTTPEAQSVPQAGIAEPVAGESTPVEAPAPLVAPKPGIIRQEGAIYNAHSWPELIARFKKHIRQFGPSLDYQAELQTGSPLQGRAKVKVGDDWYPIVYVKAMYPNKVRISRPVEAV